MVRSVIAALGLLCVGAAPATAVTKAASAAPKVSTATGTGFNGPIISKYVANPATFAAGDVCTFPVHVEFPVNTVIQRTWVNDAGTPVFATAGGVLTARVTNVATGRSARADLTGVGTFSYPGDGSLILSGNGIIAFFHSGDSPHNKIIVSLRNVNSYIAVRANPVDGHTVKSLLELDGPSEDLCQVLR